MHEFSLIFNIIYITTTMKHRKHLFHIFLYKKNMYKFLYHKTRTLGTIWHVSCQSQKRSTTNPNCQHRIKERSTPAYSCLHRIKERSTPAYKGSRSTPLRPTPANTGSRSTLQRPTPANIGSRSTPLRPTPANNGSRSAYNPISVSA